MNSVTDSSRRKFVVGGMAAVAAVGLSGCSGGGSGTVTAAPGGGGGTAAPAPTTPLIASEASDWEKLVGNAFTITGESGKAVATLASLERVVDIGRPTDLARHQGFIARFEMETALAPKGQKTYQLSHATRGVFDLFLGQPGEARGKAVLAAILN